MSTPKVAPRTPTNWRGTVISRSLKAWMSGYEMSHEDFAVGIRMVPRTFERRLKSGKFLAEEVRDCAQFMSEVSGDKVAIADLYAGRISVFGPPDAVSSSSNRPRSIGTRAVTDDGTDTSTDQLFTRNLSLAAGKVGQTPRYHKLRLVS